MSRAEGVELLSVQAYDRVGFADIDWRTAGVVAESAVERSVLYVYLN